MPTINREYIRMGDASSVDPILNNNSWEQINAVSAQLVGMTDVEAEAYLANIGWHIGDYKEVVVGTGTIDQMVFGGGTYRAYILGVNHNKNIEGTGIHFCIGKNSNGVEICFRGNSADPTNTTGVRMRTTKTNTGGWNSSVMRTTYVSQFNALLPADLQTVIKDTTKKTYSKSDSGLQTTTDKIFLMSEYEVFGSNSYADYESLGCKQYKYYVNGASKVRYRSNDTTSAAIWWERSANSGSTIYFCLVSTSGTAYYYTATLASGFVPCFKI